MRSDDYMIDEIVRLKEELEVKDKQIESHRKVLEDIISVYPHHTSIRHELSKEFK